jgi:hypothetical protein
MGTSGADAVGITSTGGAVHPRPHNAVVWWSLTLLVAAIALLAGAIAVGLVESTSGATETATAPLARPAAANLVATPVLVLAGVLAIVGAVRSRRRPIALGVLAASVVALVLVAPLFAHEALQLVGVLPR